MMARRLLPFAEQLRRYRRERGFTQEELAEHAGISARGIRALELGERGTPHKDTVRLLAEALELSPDQCTSFERAAAVTETDPTRSGPPLPIGGFLGAVPVGPIIARQHEVRHLFSVVDAVTEGAGRLVILAGEPGVGKTRLAQELTIGARARGFLLASGRCYEPEGVVPYYPFLEALTAVYQATSETIRTQVSERWPYLEWLLPNRPQVLRASEMGGQDVQQRLFWAVSGYLHAVAETVPVALLLDDLHWADESTLKLLHHLARETRGSRVLLLGTYRDSELVRQHPLERVLRDMHREGLVEEVKIRRLEQGGTAALAAALLGEVEVSTEFAMLVHQHTDGNPFFTQEVMRALVDRGDVFFQDGSWDRRALEEIEIPRSVRSAVGERVSRLSHHGQEVLHEAAVLGQVFIFDDLQRMGKWSEENLEEALEEALAAMLVRVTDKNDYAFNHALTQQTLYSELSPRKRNRLHAAVGESLAQLPEFERRRRAAQIAWHFLQADRIAQAFPFALLAGDEAEIVCAHAEAEKHYETALGLARELGDRPREAEAREKLGMVLRMMSRYDDALAVLEQAAAMCRSTGDIAGEARATHELGFAHYYRGTPELGIVRIQEMTARLENLPSAVQPRRALADLHSALAFDLWPTARYTEVRSATERAAELALEEGYTHSRALAETLRGMALAMIGPLAEARRVLEAAGALSASSGNRWWMADGIADIGRVYLDEGEFEKGRDCLQRSLVLIEALHDQSELAWVESNLGEASYLMGDWTDARTWYENAVSTARSAEARMYLSYALLHLAELCAAEGNWEEARQHIDEGLAIGQECGAVPAVRKGQRLLAEHDLRAGRAIQVVERFRHWLGSSEHDWPRAFPPLVLAEAYLDRGDVASAEELVQQRVQQFRARNHRRALALWLPVQGMVLNRQQRWSEAEEGFTEALSLARPMPFPHAEARILYEYGLMHAERGEPEQARDWLEQALAIFRNLAARPSIERTEHALEDLR